MEFKILPKSVEEINLEKQRLVRERRDYIYQIVGSHYANKGGVIKLTIEDETLIFRTQNVARRLDQIFNDLIRGKSKDKRLQEIILRRHKFTLEEVKKIGVKVNFE